MQVPILLLLAKHKEKPPDAAMAALAALEASLEVVPQVPVAAIAALAADELLLLLLRLLLLSAIWFLGDVLGHAAVLALAAVTPF